MEEARQENRRYRQDKRERRHNRRRHHYKKQGHKKTTLASGGDNGQRVEFNYVRISLELLRSLSDNRRLRWVLNKLLRQPDENRAQRSMMSAVFWPSLWAGIWKQFSADVPRSHIHYQGRTWKDPYALFMKLENSVGPLWSRWLCVFLNQAPMADVFACVVKDVEKKFGSDVVVCDGNMTNDTYFGFHLHIEETPESLKLTILKNFSLAIPDDSLAKVPKAVETEYVVTFYAHPATTLAWKYK